MLTVKGLRAFTTLPADMRQWSKWLAEALTTSLQGTLDTSQITNEAVTFAKVQNVATDTLAGRATAGTGSLEQITCTAAGRALIDDASATAQRTTLGLGTAAVQNTGTSGANVPLLSTANTWTLAQTFSKAPVLPTYTVATVPSASPAGQLIYVSDETGGAVVAFSTGTDWRRVTDRAVVS